MVRSLDSDPCRGAAIVLLPILLVVLLPGFVHAQTKRTFTPRISIEETYDDNIDLEANNTESDWITTVSPGFNVAVDSEHTKLNLDVAGGYSFYASDSSQDTYLLGTTLSLDQRLASRLSMRLSDTFTRTDDPITEEEGAITDVSRKRTVRYTNSGDASLSYQFGPEDRVTAGYRNRLYDSRSDDDEDSLGHEGYVTLVKWFGLRFGTELTGGVNRTTFEQSQDFTDTSTGDFYDYSGGITLNYRWEPSRRVYVRYTILDHRPDEIQAGTDGDTDNLNYLVHQGTLGFSLALGPRTAFDAEGGYWSQNVDGGSKRNGYAFNTALSTRREKLSLRVAGSGGYEQSYFTSENLGFSKYYQGVGSADYQLTQDLAAFASGSYRWDKYYDTEDTAGENTDRIDKTWQAAAGFRYTFLRHLTLSLDGTHTDRSSDDPDEEFTDNRVTARLTWAYGIPF